MSGFAGNIIGGLMTLVAAVVAWRSVMKQIASNEKLAKEKVAREAKLAEEARDNALRAVKPRLLRCLSALMDIVERNINLHFNCETKPPVIKDGKRLDFSDIPESNVEIIAKAIELSKGTVSKRLTDIIQSFQVAIGQEQDDDEEVWVKLPRNDYAQSTTNESNKAQMNHNYELMCYRVIEWIVVYAIAQSALGFARSMIDNIAETVDKNTVINKLTLLCKFDTLPDEFNKALDSFGDLESWYKGNHAKADITMPPLISDGGIDTGRPPSGSS
ncbi:hypothetical protein [Bartonella apis]|uniref:hypothetical protein n=1 Tax=Bartonella apis TaxID=1686310 RepID=UPI003BB6E1CC